MGEKGVDNLLKAIDNSRDRPLDRRIFSLGIRHVGAETAQVLASEFPSYDALANASRAELMSISAVGPSTADSIIKFFSQKENQQIIKRLKDAEVSFKEEKVSSGELPLAGQEFVITGTLDAFPRHEVEVRVKSLGGTFKDNVTVNTTYLVVGADPGGSKLARAQKLAIKQINEEGFLHLLGQAT